LGYAEAFFDFWSNGWWGKPARAALLVGLALLASRGFWLRLRAGPTVLEVFPFWYSLALLLWPACVGRYLLPLLPLFLFYALVGLESLTSILPRACVRAAWALTALVLCVFYAGAYATADYGPLPEGVTKSETIDCFAYIRNETDPKSVFVFSKPRALALLARRRTSGWPQGLTEGELPGFLDGLRASYIVLALNADPAFGRDRTTLLGWMEHSPNHFRQVFSNRDFRVFEIVSGN
jgi:hypothetical protein